MRYVKSIRFQLLTLMLICYLVPTLLLGQYMGSVFFTDLRDKTETALTSSAEHAYTLSHQMVERAIALAKDATYDGELTDVHIRYNSGMIGDAEFLRLSRNYIERKYSREELFTFAIYFPVDNQALLVYNRTGYEGALNYLRYAKDEIIEAGKTLDTKCLFLEVEGQVYLIRNLMNRRMERFGMLVLGISWDQLMADVNGLADTWNAEVQVCLGQAGNCSLRWDDMTEGLQAVAEGDLLTYTQREKTRDYDFGLRLNVSQNRIYGEIRAFRRLMGGLFLLLVPVMGVLMWYVYRRIVRPVNMLSEASHRIEAGELGVTVPMNGGDELGDLGVAFSNMSRRIAELIDKTYKEEIALRDAKIQAMQSRINPHFINNALETLNWQSRLEGSETMAGMVESLSVLLNASMGRGNRRMVPMREEIEVARAYCYFVGLRFGDRLTVTYHFEEAAMEAVVPLLTLQPLLENAVEHGIEPAGGGTIELWSLQAGDCLRIKVVNSGRPISEEDWKRIHAAMAGDNQGGTHLGLANVCNRLNLIYGGRASIEMYSGDDSRTVVQLTIPQDGDE